MEAVNVYTTRDKLARDILNIDDIDILEFIAKALKRAKSTLKANNMISKKELMQILKISLNEVKKIENGELAGIPAENIFD